MEKILQIINTVLDNRNKLIIKDISNSSDLRNDCGLDSLDLAELTVRIEAEYDVDIFEDGLITTVGEILNKLNESVKINEEPFSGLPVMAYYLCLKNVCKTKVILDGSGLDESLSGYSKYFNKRLGELKEEWDKLVGEYESTKLIYETTYTFQPILGEVYHIYRSKDGKSFLNLINPNEWNREHLGSYKLNTNGTWEKIDYGDT